MTKRHGCPARGPSSAAACRSACARAILAATPPARGWSRPGRSAPRSFPGWCPCPGCRARRSATAPCPGSCAGSARGRSAPRHSSASSAPSSSPATRLVEHQAVEQFVDHARVVDEDLREELAPGAQIDVELQARRVEAEQLPEHRLGPQRAGHLFQVEQRHVRVGSLGHGAQQARRDAGEKVPAAPRATGTAPPARAGPGCE